jgi:hypothetical protein
VHRLVDATDVNPIKEVTLIDENMLNRLLSDCSRSISKVIEKYKTNSSSLEDYSFFNSKIFKSFLENKDFTNLNDLRGLYTCLNVVKLYQGYPAYLQNKLLQNIIIKEFGVVSKKYAG